MGQFGYTSRFMDLKARYNYWWDWTSRLVQVGITGEIILERVEEASIADCLSRTHVDEDGNEISPEELASGDYEIEEEGE